jgi:hypothetical protein
MPQLIRSIAANLPVLKSTFENKCQLIQSLIDDGYTISTWKAFNNSLTSSDPETLSKLSFNRSTWKLTWWGASNFANSHKNWELILDKHYVVSGRALLRLNRIILGPWALFDHRIYVWNEIVHFEMRLFDNDIDKFIDFKS